MNYLKKLSMNMKILSVKFLQTVENTHSKSKLTLVID